MSRRSALLLALALAIGLAAGSPPRLPGDGYEYAALALRFASARPPAIGEGEIPELTAEVARRVPGFDARAVDPVPFMRRAGDGRLDFLHFWLYSLLAAPPAWLATTLGAPLTAGFAVANLAALLGALALAWPRLGPGACVLLFAGPIVWWIDKAHPEPLFFGTIAVSLLLLPERPGWAAVAAGLGAAQTPPLVPFLGLVILAGGPAWRRPAEGRRWLAGALAGVALAALQPAYYTWRHGVPYLLAAATRPGVPAAAESGALLADPNIGLLTNYPAWGLAVAGAVVLVARRRPRRLLAADVAVAAAGALAFLVAGATNANLHNGGTPSISRYAVWLMPLAIPVLRAAREVGSVAWERGLLALACVSAAVSTVAFHPAVRQNAREPTWLAHYLWAQHPDAHDPVPEVFMETQLPGDRHFVPVATRGCEKVLVHGDVPGWPIPCAPETVPEWCRGRYCYANLGPAGYRFVRAPGRDRGPGQPRPEVSWPAGAGPAARRFYETWGWPGLRPGAGDGGLLREVVGARVTPVVGDRAVIYVLREVEAGARLVLRAPASARGEVLTPAPGAVPLAIASGPESGARWTIALPGPAAVVLVAVERTPSG
jgi:hypothetical protein